MLITEVTKATESTKVTKVTKATESTKVTKVTKATESTKVTKVTKATESTIRKSREQRKVTHESHEICKLGKCNHEGHECHGELRTSAYVEKLDEIVPRQLNVVLGIQTDRHRHALVHSGSLIRTHRVESCVERHRLGQARS